MKVFSAKYQPYYQTYTTWERNSWTGEVESDEWNTLYTLFKDVYLFGWRILHISILREDMPKYAYCAWTCVGYSDWFEKHSKVDALYKRLTGDKIYETNTM